ncbi:hypothetical protein BOTBODRAFT_613305 [Botryobasidium botryosum FD-172 SS1]|uniref:Zn(2)-C6 fungal-type domain-containing protein n=1 Tax=Botryobasidium botryosum (strain FD-172 SS1) TaxID=930990 RepID=A0A067LV91_BOTB1|nr:hypothetical protein BOTBODRAFT_613305 [Botryobasidium botryosum FD-172 SS1]
MLLSYPALERGTACTPCRKRKRRCDGVRPVCDNCASSNGLLNCAYTPNRRQLLQRQVAELESQIDSFTLQANSSGRDPAVPISNKLLNSTSLPSAIGEHSHISGSRTRAFSIATFQVNAGGANLFVSRPLEDPSIARWKVQDEVPHGIRDHLIMLFLQFRWRHPFEFSISRLLWSLDLPSTHPKAPHPVLVNAILLHGCLYAESSFRPYERVFFNRICRHLHHSLAHADRLLDCVTALALFSCYFYGKWRTAEGHYYISGSMSLAIACGLNRITSLDLGAQDTASLIDPATDLIELGDRVNTFWTVFSIERTGAMFSGIACRPADREISTIWPCPSDYYEDGRAYLRGYGTIGSLYNGDADDNPVALRAKGYASLNRASTLLAKSTFYNSSHIDSFPDDIHIACTSLCALADSLSACQHSLEYSISADGIKSIMAIAFTAAQAAVIQIYNIPALAKTDPSALDRQQTACRHAMLAVREVNTLAAEYFPLGLGASCFHACSAFYLLAEISRAQVTLLPVYKFLVRETRRVDVGHTIVRIEEDIGTLLRTFERVKGFMALESEAGLHQMWYTPASA